MRVVIKKDYKVSSLWTAEHIAKSIKSNSGERPYVLGLPTGSTPIGVYDELIKQCKAGALSFKNVVTFNMDEYVGLSANHPQSYHYFMQEHLFSHIDIQQNNVHILNGMAADLASECLSYEAAIKAAGGIDLFLGGLGSDGHIAFNEPGSSLSSITRIKTLTEETIAANARFFDGDETKVPRRALTVGVGTICAAREVVILAAGKAKAQAVQQAVEGAVSQMRPVTALQMHRDAILVCDEEAAEDLRYGTVKYFTDIEGKM